MLTDRLNVDKQKLDISCLLRFKYEDLIKEIVKTSTPKKRECFITYAWEPDTQEFVKYHLVPDLEKAGLAVIVDFKNLSISQNVIDHEMKIAEVPYVCVVGTPKLKQKYESYKVGTPSGIGFELMMLHTAKFQRSTPYGKVFPLLFKGKGLDSLTIPLQSIVYGNDGNGSGLQGDNQYPYKENLSYYTELLRIIAGILEVPQDIYVRGLNQYHDYLLTLKEIPSEDQIKIKKWQSEYEFKIEVKDYQWDSLDQLPEKEVERIQKLNKEKLEKIKDLNGVYYNKMAMEQILYHIVPYTNDKFVHQLIKLYCYQDQEFKIEPTYHGIKTLSDSFDEWVQTQNPAKKMVWAKAWGLNELARRIYYAKGHYKDAIVLYQSAMKVLQCEAISPKDYSSLYYAQAIAYGKMAVVKQKSSLFKLAIESYDKAINFYRTAPLVSPSQKRNFALCYNNKAVDLVNLALNYYQNNTIEFDEALMMYAEALNSYRNALKIDFNYPTQWGWKGTILMNGPLNYAALDFPRLLCDIEVSSLTRCYDLTDSQRIHYYLLLKICSQIKATQKENSPLPVAYGYASALEKLGNSKQAIVEYERIIKDYPNFFLAYCDLGFIYFKRENYAQALEYFEFVDSQTKNSCLLALYGKALILSEKDNEVSFNQKQNIKAALNIYRFIEKMNEKFPSHFNNQGVLWFRLEKYNEALSCFEKALEYAPQDVFALVGMATALLKLKKTSSALIACDKALRICDEEMSNQKIFSLSRVKFKQLIEHYFQKENPVSENIRLLRLQEVRDVSKKQTKQFELKQQAKILLNEIMDLDEVFPHLKSKVAKINNDLLMVMHLDIPESFANEIVLNAKQLKSALSRGSQRFFHVKQLQEVDQAASVKTFCASSESHVKSPKLA